MRVSQPCSYDKISLIIPVYNISNYLDDMLQSIEAQTYKNLEVILIDDGSIDDSGIVCERWTKFDQRFYCIHTKNQGVSKARNEGLQRSTGNYILFIDGDDTLAPNMCEILVNRLLEDKSDVSYCGFYNVFEDHTEIIIPQRKILSGSQIQRELVTQVSFFTAVWNKLFRREVLMDRSGNFIPFIPGIYVGEDALWLAKVLKNAQKISSVSQALYYWQRRTDSATQGKTQVRTDAFYLTVLDAYQQMLLELNDPFSKKILCKKYLGICRDCMIQAYQEGNKELSRRLRQRIQSDYKIYDHLDLFTIKLKMCTSLVSIGAPMPLLKWVNTR